MSAKTYRTVPVRNLSSDELLELSKKQKLSLSREDMEVVQQIFREIDRDPTDVELEVIAQTWSEHCKHRIFSASISHSVNGGAPETVNSLFKTYIKKPSEKIMERKPGFVLSAFDDNAGFIALDDNLAVCLKAETHNHPSAIEPYAGANTGLGGVIRDILGAGKGAKPIASLDVFCFGAPDTNPADITAPDVIHPLGIMRGVVRGVRDYGNRMGIPTVNGAIQFDPTYIYNPLVFCGTAGVIPRGDILKEMRPGLKVIVIGGARVGTVSREPRSPPPLWMKPPMRKTSPPCKSATRLKRRKRWTSFWKRVNAASSSSLRTAAPAASLPPPEKCSPSQAVKFSWTTPLSRNPDSSPGKSSCRNPRNAWSWPWRKKTFRNSGSWQTPSRRN